ncbi:hypothetical protein [Micromonospora rubida]|uniref:hypothetical protein n=1 Tax=Micromonospora rubida TaxID=2697657 RepID=UPI001378517A|nr:hypothetical protein [Micromonospora rubida]NBE79781.1 hypothetical protein [Micromonospora rubida]
MTSSGVHHKTSPCAPAAVPRVPPATRREDLVTVLFGACLTAGAMSDGWAHSNIVETIEGFFTPWHGLLYAGFVATAAWTFWLAYQRRDAAPRWWRDAFPAGYRVGAIGAVVFLLAGLADMAWHEILGVEVGLDAEFSPSHLLLDASAVLLLTSPLRSWWASGERGGRSATGVASLALGVMVPSILLTYASAFLTLAPTRAIGAVGTQQAAILGVDAYLITTLVLVGPFLLAHRRRATPGTAAALAAGVALFDLVMHEFPTPQAWAALGAVCGAGLADVLLLRLDAIRGRDAALRLPLAGALLAGLVVAGHLAGLALDAGIGWTPEVTTGVITLAALLGALLGGLAARPAPAPDPADPARIPPPAGPARIPAPAGPAGATPVVADPVTPAPADPVR